jgi:hypothetical protein
VNVVPSATASKVKPASRVLGAVTLTVAIMVDIIFSEIGCARENCREKNVIFWKKKTVCERMSENVEAINLRRYQ